MKWMPNRRIARVAMIVTSLAAFVVVVGRRHSLGRSKAKLAALPPPTCAPGHRKGVIRGVSSAGA